MYFNLKCLLILTDSYVEYLIVGIIEMNNQSYGSSVMLKLHDDNFTNFLKAPDMNLIPSNPILKEEIVIFSRLIKQDKPLLNTS